MAEGEEFRNGMTLLDSSSWELKQWELVRWIESLVAWLTSCMFIIDSEFDSTASESTYDQAHVDGNIADRVSVEI